jgi:hypothetical protein
MNSIAKTSTKATLNAALHFASLQAQKRLKIFQYNSITSLEFKQLMSIQVFAKFKKMQYNSDPFVLYCNTIHLELVNPAILVDLEI